MWPVVGIAEGWPLPPVCQQTLGLTTVMLGLSRAQQGAAGNRRGVGSEALRVRREAESCFVSGLHCRNVREANTALLMLAGEGEAVEHPAIPQCQTNYSKAGAGCAALRLVGLLS